MALPRSCWLLLMAALSLVTVATAHGEQVPIMPPPQAPAGATPMDAARVAPPPAAPTLIYGSTPIPANGGLVLNSQQQVTAAMVQVLDPNGQAVPGKLTWYGVTGVWVPDQPLVPGATYSVTLLPAYGSVTTGSNNYKVAVTAAHTPQRPVLSSTVGLTLLTLDEFTQCCAAINGAVTRCFPTASSTYASMQVELSTVTLANELTQYLFELAAAPSMPVGQYSQFNPNPGPFRFLTKADEYCFEIKAIDIASGQVFSYSDLMPRCKPHGMLGDVGSHTIALDEKQLGHDLCAVPPTAYATQWCDINAAACSGAPLVTGCANYGHLCRGEPLATAAGTGGAGGARAAAGSGGATAPPSSAGAGAASRSTAGVAARAGQAGSVANAVAGAASFIDNGPASSRSKGCSIVISVGAQPSAGSGLAYLGLGLLFAGRRRRG